MGKSKLSVKNVHKTKKTVFVAAGIIAVVITGFIFTKFNSKGNVQEDLIILKSEISDNVKFYPYKSGKTNMEVMAVRASDGTIRTAFNTCQICYDSGRGYYKQEGDKLVCQNCGNRFSLDQLEKLKGGCNPVPITKEYKTEDDEVIVISQAFMDANKGLFGNWKKQ
ncbi:putative membrane protein DUF2318 [Herbinix hemicellulosilytica]|uniref:Membrane iron-sulfur containing protein FtrD-like domain-containing protein n=1 Tax=Herbinix hemicellulosilytica TaxID=1564487 RepID=A0A0H5SGX3_HERHM|nr:DUF2318 domain-containing protein [Herbinix hemicellulosilytica]RBP58943.1 putative membrane protein DUF2318 [Herbinix hemicellulosilytica]CRZ34031.1 hypothetical protein HHT355_0828 [Herbinix hemicellulosilytica]